MLYIHALSSHVSSLFLCWRQRYKERYKKRKRCALLAVWSVRSLAKSRTYVHTSDMDMYPILHPNTIRMYPVLCLWFDRVYLGTSVGCRMATLDIYVRIDGGKRRAPSTLKPQNIIPKLNILSGRLLLRIENCSNNLCHFIFYIFMHLNSDKFQLSKTLNSIYSV